MKGKCEEGKNKVIDSGDIPTLDASYEFSAGTGYTTIYSYTSMFKEMTFDC